MQIEIESHNFVHINDPLAFAQDSSHDNFCVENALKKTCRQLFKNYFAMFFLTQTTINKVGKKVKKQQHFKSILMISDVVSA